jgi:arginyl-tRNA synthetase
VIPTFLQPHLDLAARDLCEGVVDPVQATTDPRHGDYQWNLALRLGKERKQNPREVAALLRERLLPAGGAKIRAIEIAGPGFLNVQLDDAWLAQVVREQALDARMGVEQSGGGRTVVIDYSSPNVAKRMHVGHMRSTQVGAALDRMHRAAGWSVIADNHLGDWGTPFGKLFVAWERWRDEEAFAADPVGELERLYVKFGELAESNPALGDEARERTARLQSGDPEIRARWETFLQASLGEFQLVYDRMGVAFDVVLGESTYHSRVAPLITRLLESGAAEESQEAIVVRVGEQVAVVQKRDGAATYMATDLACIEYRLERWAPDRIVYVTDTRQQGHFRLLFEVARKTGVATELVHAWFGMLVLPVDVGGGGAMSTRSGNVVRLVELLDEAAARARALAAEKTPDLDPAELDRIGEAVGVGAVRWADLSQHPQTDVKFTWEKMLAMDGNTAPYLLYSHARCCSLLARGQQTPDLGALSATEAVERELLLALARYPEAMAAALRSYRPNLLCDYLYDLANRVHRFYHDCPVLQGGERRAARLALVEASRRVLRHGMEVVGLTVLERM